MLIGALRTLQELLLFISAGRSLASSSRFPEATRGLLYAGSALVAVATLLAWVGFYFVRGVPAIGNRAGNLLLPEPEEYQQPPPFALGLALPPRQLLLRHLGPADVAARLESCMECWLASPRRRCPRGADEPPPSLGTASGVSVDAGGDGATASAAAATHAAPGARSPHNEPLQCAMCYEVYSGTDGGAWLALVCGHVFHTACIMKWAAHQAASGSHVHCPLDRVLVSQTASSGMPRRRGLGRDADGGAEGWMRNGVGGWRSSRGRGAAVLPAGAVVLSPVAAPSEGGVA